MAPIKLFSWRCTNEKFYLGRSLQIFIFVSFNCCGVLPPEMQTHYSSRNLFANPPFSPSGWQGGGTPGGGREFSSLRSRGPPSYAPMPLGAGLRFPPSTPGQEGPFFVILLTGFIFQPRGGILFGFEGFEES